ncbi:Colicin I receptor precursor [Burkholderia oklahomensis]|nr:tonB dependent receptor family protein [Burkholderia oklahomensis C6786]AOI49873.1 ligand-gated channel [Burkholderia oklahomensis C6786]KUY47251.1 ligand-gated channel [Burkholderia oklahomensis C6786]SUY28763.1 Colicin I receptor precursor [Burkholderia oklahomensis]
MRYQRAWRGRLPASNAFAMAVAISLIPLSGVAHASTAGTPSAKQSDSGPAGGAGAASGVTAAGELSAVTITASKRDQSLATLNGAAVVVEQPALDDAQVANTFDLARVLPGVQITSGGSMLFPMIGLRGISSAQDFYNPALTVYVDGVPQLPTFSSQTLLSVDRVELLKGPQGTLYGKSAEGGVLNIVTLPPDNTPRVHLRAGVSSRGGNVEQAEVAGPLVKDLLYGAVSLAHVDAPGDLRNPVSGANHQGGSRSFAGSAKLRLAPSGAPWEVNVSVGRDCAKATQDIYVPFDDIGSRAANIDPRLPAQYAESYMRRCGNSYALSGRYDFGQWRLSAISAWQTVDIERRFPFLQYFTQQPEDWRQNVQELRLATHAPGRRWDAVFGLYRHDVHQSRTYVNDMVIPSVVNLSTTASSNESKSLAAYGDVTWHVTDALDLSAGLRASRDQAWTQFAGTAMASASTYVPFAGVNGAAGNRILGKVSAGYQIDPAWRVYANVSQGYKPGGFNLAPSSLADAQGYGPERAVSYELGARYTGRSLRGSVALYRIDIRNAQLYGSDPLGYQSLRNVGDTRSTGVELGVEWGIARGWTAGLDGFVNHATFRSYADPFGCATCAGNDVPFAPRYGFTLNVGGEVPTLVGTVRPRVAVRWLGAQYFDVANKLRQGGYALVDASLGWRPRRDVEFTLYAQNLTNRDYRAYAFRAPTGNLAQVGLGRTVGVTVAFDY